MAAVISQKQKFKDLQISWMSTDIPEMKTRPQIVSLYCADIGFVAAEGAYTMKEQMIP